MAKVKIDKDAGTILLPEPGMALDLGGITKGYALNRAAEILKESGLPGALVNIGGDILAYGEKEPGKPWRRGRGGPERQESRGSSHRAQGSPHRDIRGLRAFFYTGWKAVSSHPRPCNRVPGKYAEIGYGCRPDRNNLQPLGTATFVMGEEKGLKFVETIQGATGS